MKKVFLIIGAVVISIAIFTLGFVSGNYLYDYDVLCERWYTPHKLKKEFVSKEGISLSAGTIVYARGCKPNTDVRLEFYVDNWNYQNLEKLEKDPRPAYYFDIKDEK